jgi:hypothetical protein
MMAVAIAVTVMTEGAGAEMIGAASGSMEATIANAAVSSMASSAATGVLTGNFDLGNVLKAGLTGGLTAGLTQGLGFNQTAGIKDLGNGIVKGSFDAAKLGDALMGIAGRGLVNAGVNSAINGTSFGEGFKQSVINDAAAIGASAIGTAWGGGKDPVMQTVAHAGLGAITAKLRGQDVVAGALGGATESVLGNLVSDSAVSGNGGKALYAAAATLAGGIVSNALGRDAVTAGQTAQNAAVNNRLLHTNEIERIKSLAKTYAAQNKISVQEAETQLTAQALRDTDATYHEAHAQDDSKAESFLRANATTFVDEQGRTMLMFANMGYYNNPNLYAYTRQTYAAEYAAAEGKVANASQSDKLATARRETEKAIVGGAAKGLVNLPIDSVNGVLTVAETLPRAIGVDLGTLPKFPTIPYSSEAEQQVARDTQAVAATAAGAIGAANGGVLALADTQVTLTQQVADLRATLPNNIRNSGNMGVAQIDIPGVQSTMAASSRIDAPSTAQQSLGFVGKVPETFQSSTVLTADNYALNRAFDSEAKILNNIAAQLGENTSATGTINLLTERAPCASCSNIIEQFQAKYPNIKINVMDNGGTNIPPSKKGP